MSMKKSNEDYLDNFLLLLGKESKFCIIMGDFNINLLNTNRKVSDLIAYNQQELFPVQLLS